jgi:hypothetical protein
MIQLKRCLKESKKTDFPAYFPDGTPRKKSDVNFVSRDLAVSFVPKALVESVKKWVLKKVFAV